MPLVDIRPMDFIFVSFQLFPLYAGMQYIEDIVENLVIGDFLFHSFNWSTQTRFDVSVKIFLRYPDW